MGGITARAPKFEPRDAVEVRSPALAADDWRGAKRGRVTKRSLGSWGGWWYDVEVAGVGTTLCHLPESRLRAVGDGA